MKRRYSIQHYLKLFILLWVLLVSIITTVWMYYDAKHEIDELFDASLVQSARILDNLLQLHPLDKKTPDLNHISKQVSQSVPLEVDGHEYEKKVAFQVWSTTGKLLFKSLNAPQKQFSPSKKGFHRTIIHQHQWRTFSLYSKENNWWLLVAESDEIREELASHIVRDHVIPLLFGIPLLLLVLHFLIKKGLAPLRKIARLLNKKHHQDLSAIDNKNTPEEALGLVDSLNRLFIKLEESYLKESRFSADAAHELRNPLAALMIHTDNAIEDTLHIQKTESSSVNSFTQEYLNQQALDLGHIKSSIKRLTHSVQQLLALSRAENQVTEEDYSEFNLYQLCHSLVQQNQSLLEDQQQVITINIEESYYFKGYKTLFNILVGNLLSNAIKYSGKHSQIYLNAVIADDQSLSFSCEDSGLGLPSDQIARVKDRFYRVPSNHSYGAGLGLSITDAIIKQHHGKWEISKSDLGGLKIAISLPYTIQSTKLP